MVAQGSPVLRVYDRAGDTHSIVPSFPHSVSLCLQVTHSQACSWEFCTANQACFPCTGLRPWNEVFFLLPLPCVWTKMSSEWLAANPECLLQLNFMGVQFWSKGIFHCSFRNMHICNHTFAIRLAHVWTLCTLSVEISTSPVPPLLCTHTSWVN